VEGDKYGYNNRQKVIDYAFRATHRTAQVSELVIEAFYGVPARYSYFVAGSAGGRQALMEAQRYPDDFDGILLSAPVYNISRVHMWGVWKAIALSGEGHIEPGKVPVISKAVYDRCDDNDGVLDGVIDYPPDCDFDPAKHLRICDSEDDAATCFTQSQIDGLKNVYGGVRNSSGEILFPGQPVGAETVGDMPAWMGADGPQSAWNDWIVVPAGDTPRFVRFAESFLRYTAFEIDDPEYDWRTFDFDNDPARMAMASSIVDADNPSLQAFRAAGGKMIHYHHWADTAVPATNSINYFERAQAANGDTGDFYRFYLVPGGFHGSPGVGATEIPWLEHIVNWVENGQAPGELVARRSQNGETMFTRRICPYPLRSVYDGEGSPDIADSFQCMKENRGGN
jgi:feruloyl esterase